MEKKEMLLALIEGLKEELTKRKATLQTVISASFDQAITEEQNRLMAELTERIKAFKTDMEDNRRAKMDNINLDICAINRIIADKANELAEIENAELATVETAANETIAQ